MDVAKIDRDVAHVAIVVHVCCKRPFQMFHLLFQMYVASVLIWMLHMLHTYVARVCSNCSRCMLQVFHMDVAKVDHDVAHVAMAIHVCCKRPFQMFYLPFSNVCCKCAYLDVAYVSHTYCKCMF